MRVLYRTETLTVVSVSSRPFLFWDKSAGTVYTVVCTDLSGATRRLGCREYVVWEVA